MPGKTYVKRTLRAHPPSLSKIVHFDGGVGGGEKKPGSARLFDVRLPPLLLFRCDFGVSAFHQHDNGHRRSVTRTRTYLQDA